MIPPYTNMALPSSSSHLYHQGQSLSPGFVPFVHGCLVEPWHDVTATSSYTPSFVWCIRSYWEAVLWPSIGAPNRMDLMGLGRLVLILWLATMTSVDAKRRLSRAKWALTPMKVLSQPSNSTLEDYMDQRSTQKSYAAIPHPLHPVLPSQQDSTTLTSLPAPIKTIPLRWQPFGNGNGEAKMRRM